MDEQSRTESTGRLAAGLRLALCVALVATFVLAAGGCTRRFFRRAADKEVAELYREKDKFPFWKLEHFHVYPDPRARFADPTNPDRPPMPPDDPAAHALSPNPQRPKDGVARIENTAYLKLLSLWDEHNRAEYLARQGEEKDVPNVARLPVSDTLAAAEGDGAGGTDGSQGHGPRPYILNLEQAAELGLINSRQFQDQREDLYLTALPVTFERFSFAYQFFLTNETIREIAGSESSVGKQNRWISNSSAGFSKLFATGALLTLSYANETIINLTGNLRHTTSVSTLNLDLVQPLLRGGGFAVNLEPLTQVERNLVYAIREFARFRKEYFVQVATGLGAQADVFFGDASALGGGFGTGDQFGGNQGYLPTLRLASQVANERKNVAALMRALDLFRGYEEGGIVEPLQVSRIESQLLNSQSSLLRQALSARNALDQFKLQLGLPANVPLELDDAPLQPLTAHFQRYEKIIADFDAAIKEFQAQESLPPGQVRDFMRKVFTGGALVKGTKFARKLPEVWAGWEKLTDQQAKKRQLQLLEERRKLQGEKADADLKGVPFGPDRERRLREVEFELVVGHLEVARLEEARLPGADQRGPLRVYEAEPWKARPKEAGQKLRGDLFDNLVDAFNDVLVEARNERLAALSKTWPAPPPVAVEGIDLLQGELEQAQEIVTYTAMQNRLDLMNERARVVDAWRQVKVAANALMGVFDVAYHMDSLTPPDQAKPLAFSGKRTRHQLILNTELPLVRVAERNDYRAVLIQYQRQRRTLMATEDQIAASVRDRIRQLRFLAQDYRIQQKAIELAYAQVESSLEAFKAPPDPQQARSPTSTGNQAALTDQYLRSQSGLLGAQNRLYGIWVDYLTNRLRLYLDMELMPLDYRGVWIDELATRASLGSPHAADAPGGGHHGDERGGLDGELPAPRLLPPAPAPAPE
jgi:hypothetical protein